ncbi:MAG: recombinase RecA [Alphaproteobacteria bacterium TMED194]|nr:MAG: recombinase RecA [Alphaproteobacteria bacterium TMED194]|tara:strand:+ start:20253 stop:21299 length:1047 start_codon:yes stop_codon:yes gene_type:complete
MSGSDFLKEIIKTTGNEYATLADAGIESGDVTDFIDTGSYIFNALLSGSLYGGLPQNKITALAGESATGKTFFLMGIVKHFLDANPDGGVVYFESESAITKKMIVDRGIDAERMVVVPVTTVQEFRTQSIKILDRYMQQDVTVKRPMFMCLDSLGMLSTTKEVEDTAEGKETRDMTRAQVLKAAFRVLTLKLGKAKVPMVVTNHTYDSMGSMFPTKEMGGGSGLKYAASSIVFLSKRKEKVGTDVVGNIIHCKNHKSRLTKENSIVDVRLMYSKGLDKYYGLLPLAEKYDIFKKVSTKYELPDGKKVFGKSINDNPETYFTKEVLDKLEIAAKKEFSYGGQEETKEAV